MPSEMPGVKRQMLCDSTYLRYFKSSQSHKDRNCNSSCLGLRGGKNVELLFNGYKFHLGKIKMFWRYMVVIVDKNVNVLNALTIHLRMV